MALIKKILLLHPPAVRLCEPPAGVLQIAGVLRQAGVPCRVIDFNQEGLFFHFEQKPVGEDTWTKRAADGCREHVEALQQLSGYQNFSTYQRMVGDLQRVLSKQSVSEKGWHLGLANCEQKQLKPTRSRDLLHCAEHPEENPFYPYFVARLQALLNDWTPDIIGISLNYLTQALTAFALIGFLRRAIPGTKIVMGGGLVTSWLSWPNWCNPFEGLADSWISGPGEEALLKIALGDSTEKREPVRIEENVDPVLRLPYLSPGLILPYSLGSGCFWKRCSFCPERAEDSTYVPKKWGKAYYEITDAIKKTHPVLIHFLDNAISPEAFRNLAQNPLPVPWYGFARFSNVLKDEAFCLELRRSGCVMLQLGLESGDQGVLDRLQKGIALPDVEQILESLHRAGIAAYVYLLFGTPAEDETSARNTLDFVVKHHKKIGFFNLAIFNLPAFCPETADLQTTPFYDGDLSLYRDFIHPRGWDRKAIRAFLDREFRAHPAIAPIVQRDPPVFTSNHASFFTKAFSRHGKIAKE